MVAIFKKVSLWSFNQTWILFSYLLLHCSEQTLNAIGLTMEANLAILQNGFFLMSIRNPKWPSSLYIYFFWPIYCLSFLDLCVLITPLVSSNFSDHIKLFFFLFYMTERFFSEFSYWIDPSLYMNDHYKVCVLNGSVIQTECQCKTKF